MFYLKPGAIVKYIPLLLLPVMSACGTGGATSSGSGASSGQVSVQGNVASSSLPGGVDGITVAASGRSAQTDTRGSFSLANVSAGSQAITFSKSGQVARLVVNVPAAGILKLVNVRIIGGDSVASQLGSTSSSSSRSSVTVEREEYDDGKENDGEDDKERDD